MMNRIPLSRLLGAAVLTATLAFGASAGADTPTSKAPGAAAAEASQAYRYQLRALGQSAGEAILFIGAMETVGRRKVRPVRLEAKTSGLAAKFMRAVSSSTTWVDRQWLPVRARWDVHIKGAQRVYKTKYRGKQVIGTQTRDGKPFNESKYTLKERGTDIVSVFTWIMHQDMTAGTRYGIDLFDGRRIYEVLFDVGTPEQIHVPVGLRQAIPLRGKLRRGAAFERDVVLWLSASEDRTPLKLVFKYGLLGDVEILLTSQRKV